MSVGPTLLLAFAGASLLPRPLSAGVVRTAVRTGSWTSTTTWGAPVPTVYDSATIPAGITVTVPSGASVTIMATGDTGKINVSGTLEVSGSLTSTDLVLESGGRLTINSTGVLTASGLYKSSGTVVNKGRFQNQARFFYEYGSLTNETGATLNCQSSTNLNSVQPFTNRGTVTVTSSGSLEVYSPVENYGTITITSNGSVSIQRNFHNHSGASLSLAGLAKMGGCCGITNDGKIANTGSYFQNDGQIVNSCTGVYSGTAPTGNPVKTNCAGGAPTPTPAPAGGSAPSGWTGLSFQAADIAVGANGTAWFLDPNGSIFRLQNGAPAQVAGQAVRIAVDPAGVPWVVNATGVIYKWTGSAWQQMPGAAMDIGIGANGKVWILDTAGAPASWNGSGWTKLGSGQAVRISVDPSGNIWVVNAGHVIWRWAGSWTQMPGSGQDVSVGGDGTVYVVGDGAGTGGYQIYRWAGSSWTPESGVFGTVAAAGKGLQAFVGRSGLPVIAR